MKQDQNRLNILEREELFFFTVLASGEFGRRGSLSHHNGKRARNRCTWSETERRDPTCTQHTAGNPFLQEILA